VLVGVLLDEDVVELYIAMDNTLRLLLTIDDFLETFVVLFHLGVVTEGQRKTQEILLILDEIEVDEFQDFCHLQSNLINILLIKCMFSL
jgi:hypothetical protein